MKPLDEKTQNQVEVLINQGNAYSDDEHHVDALRCYCEALDLFPDSLEKREDTMWLLTVIGDSLFHLGSFEKAIDALSNAIRCGGLGNPFIHLRLGQSQYEVGNQDKAADELARAYMAAGEEIFQDEPVKYFEFLKTRIVL